MSVWGFLKKAGELIAPIITTNSLNEFRDCCENALKILSSLANDEIFTLPSTFESISDSLIEEMNQIDMPCFNLFVSNSYLQKYANLLGPSLSNAQISPTLRFFISFVNTKLNSYFFQVSVHQPLTMVVSKLEKLYSKCPDQVHEFAFELWAASKKSPLILEMIVYHIPVLSYPLLDFFIEACQTTSETGSSSRDALLSFFSRTDSGGAILSVPLMEYISGKLFPILLSLLKDLSSSCATIQFNGSLSTITNWVDQMLSRSGGFPMEPLMEHIGSLPKPKILVALSFLLSFFSSECVLKPAIQNCISPSILGIIYDCLDSDDFEGQISSVSLIKSMILTDECIPYILPPTSDLPSDVLSLLPPEWLVELNGSSSMECYEYDAASRIELFGPQREGNNVDLIHHLLGLFIRFKSLPLSLCLSITQLIALMIAAEPTLVSSQLVNTFESVVHEYKDVQRFENPQERPADTPELRAFILSEFGKEIHSTFLAAEKIMRLNTMYK